MTTDVQPPRSRRRTWLIAAVVAWGVLITAAGVYGARNGRPTVAEQTTIVDAVPTLDRVAAEVAAAGIAAGAVATISGYVRTDRTCRIAPGRAGERWERTAMLYTVAGKEGALLDAVAAATPKAWKLTVRRSASGPHRISGDAGSYVRVVGAVSTSGQIRVSAQTGCRERGGALPQTPAGGAARRAPVEALLAALGVPATDWREFTAACPRGGAVWTVEATARRQDQTPLSTVLRDTPGAILAMPDVFAARNGQAGVVARSGIDAVVVSSTTPCQ